MYALARPFLFSLDPRAAHALAMAALLPLEWTPLRAVAGALFRPRDPHLARRVMGIDFPSPVGLAGGFDKNATRARALGALGFGFLELGTVTALAQTPNPRPNLFRLPADRALVNRLGFPNDGAETVARRFASRGGARAVGVPVGFSIGKSRAVAIGDLEAVIADYTQSFLAVRGVADFVVVNVSSPNTKDLRALQGKQLADGLLGALAAKNAEAGKKPLLVKVAPDLDDAELDALLEVVDARGLDGVVATNTTIRRDGLVTPKERIDAIGAGGLSGRPLFPRALEIVRRVRAALPRIAVIGVGGVERGEHARAMLDAGADLVQLYTAFVYRGPLTARAIARELLHG